VLGEQKGITLTADGKYSRVIRIRDYQSKLGAGMPTLGRLLWVGII